MADDNSSSYGFCLRSSRTSIICDSAPYFLNHETCESSFLGSRPITIFSSSNGLMAWCDSTNTYYIGNPFVQNPNSCVPLPKSRYKHPPNTHVVLATEFSSLGDPAAYHLICAFPDKNTYSFDTYTSEIDCWIIRMEVDLKGRDIIPNSGISCRGFAFWLTETPRSVLRFDPLGICSEEFYPLPVLDLPVDRMRLGIVKNQLGLVLVDASAINLYLLQEEGNNMFGLFARLKLSICEEENWSNLKTLEIQDEFFVCKEIPRPVKFESLEKKAYLWVDGGVVVWELNTIDPQRTHAFLLPINEGIQVADGFIYDTTSLLPENFSLLIQDNDDGESQFNDRLAGSSMFGIIYYEDQCIPRLILRLVQTSFHPPNQHDACNMTICSSSDGLIALYSSSTNSYYIGNPLIPNYHSYIRLPTTPRQHHAHQNSTHVVLATDLSKSKSPQFYLICATHEETKTTFTFDIYWSVQDAWASYNGVNVPGNDIVPNTGVSCGGFVYWLTGRPRMVVGFEARCVISKPKTFWIMTPRKDPTHLGSGFADLYLPETRLQLGRVGKKLGLVVIDASVNDPMVILHLLTGDKFHMLARLKLSISEDADWNNVSLIQDGFLICRTMPRPIRFQSHKKEVFLWVDGRVILWESSNVDPRKMCVVLLPPENVTEDVTTGFAYVGSSLLPDLCCLFPYDSDLDEDNRIYC